MPAYGKQDDQGSQLYSEWWMFWRAIRHKTANSYIIEIAT
jgi:hypothetical protein